VQAAELRAKLKENEDLLAEMNQSWDAKLKASLAVQNAQKEMLGGHGASLQEEGGRGQCFAPSPHLKVPRSRRKLCSPEPCQALPSSAKPCQALPSPAKPCSLKLRLSVVHSVVAANNRDNRPIYSFF
jgi:hypothetical protein